MPLPRMTTRRWMLAVAVVAVLSFPLCGVRTKKTPIGRIPPTLAGTSVRAFVVEAPIEFLVGVYIDLIHPAAFGASAILLLRVARNTGTY
jgi:hypothetical protein